MLVINVLVVAILIFAIHKIVGYITKSKKVQWSVTIIIIAGFTINALFALFPVAEIL